MAAPTVIVTDCTEVPPVPAQLRVYVLVLEGVTVREAEVLWAPLQLPDAVHESAFVELQVRTLEAPAVIDAGEALRLMVGAGVLLLDELLELLELLDPLPLPLPLLPLPLPLVPPLPPPHAASVNMTRNKTGRRFMEASYGKVSGNYGDHFPPDGLNSGYQ